MSLRSSGAGTLLAPDFPFPASNIAVLASGGGTNLRALYDATIEGRLSGMLRLVLSNNSESGALEFARAQALPHHHFSLQQFQTQTEPLISFEAAMLELFEAKEIGLIILAGYMKLVPPTVVKRYHQRILNVHPALIPAFAGSGMFGERVHRAVLERGCKVTGATVHLVDEEYDRGPIVLQEACNVLEDDTVESLRLRVQAIEHRLLPRAADLVVRNKCRIIGNTVKILN